MLMYGREAQSKTRIASPATIPKSGERKQNTTPERRPDCVTEIRMGNTVLIVSGFFKKDTTDTAADKMMKVLEAEAAAGHKAQLSP